MKKIVSLVLMLAMLFYVASADTFPLVTEPTTLEIACRTPANYPDQDNSKVSCMIAYEDLTGVHIEWDNIPASEFDNTLAASISADDYPGIIMKGRLAQTTANEWGDEGILIDLSPYLEECCPNFSALMEEYPDIRTAITNGEGKIYGLPQVVLAPAVRANTKIYYNTKAMEAAGYTEFPKDLASFKDYLIALKGTQYNVGLVASVDQLRNYFLGIYGLRNRGTHYDVVDVDPETHEPRIWAQSPRFRECMEYLHDLYADGLIYQELFTNGANNVSAQSGKEELGVYISTATFAITPQFMDDYDGVQFLLEGPYGDQIMSDIRSNLHSVNNFCITDRCENVELALRWVDYFYSEEGSQYFLLGVPNQDWEVKEDGSVYFTDAALATWEDTMTQDAFKAQFGMWPGGRVPAAFYDNLCGAEFDPIPRATAYAMLQYASDVIWPFFNWTLDENEVIKTVEKDIKSYITNAFAQAVAGEIEITDAWWNEFVSQIDAMGAEKLLATYKQVLGRVYPDGNY